MERGGGKGVHFLGLNVFFIVERLGKGRLFTGGFFFLQIHGRGEGSVESSHSWGHSWV